MKELIFYGRGGQGVVTAAKLMVSCVIAEGRYANSVPSFGQERKGAPVFTYARISDDPIPLRTFVYEPDAVVVFDLFVRELGVDITKGARDGALLVTNTAMAPEEVGAGDCFARIGCLDATRLTRELLGPVPPNAAMLGALAATTGWIALDSVCQALRESMPGRKGELNAVAARQGYERTRVAEFR